MGTVLDDIGDPDAQPGSRAWALWAVHYAKMRRDDLDKDAASLRRCITTIQLHEAWKVLGYPSFDMLCVTRLQLSSDEVSAVLTAPKGSTVGAVLGKHGGQRKAGTEQAYNVILKPGNQTDYLAARLRRDFPDVQFDESIRGSVRKAAIECGIVKPLKTCVLSDPETVAGKIVETMGADFARAVLGALAAKCEVPVMRSDEIERRRIVEAGGSVIANQRCDHALIAWAKSQGLAVRIDRRSAYGNPFKIGSDGDRNQVCDSYAARVATTFDRDKLVTELSGRVLLCWCWPERCHGETLVDIVESAMT